MYLLSRRVGVGVLSHAVKRIFFPSGCTCDAVSVRITVGITMDTNVTKALSMVGLLWR
jgi:hypothetical protein